MTTPDPLAHLHAVLDTLHVRDRAAVYAGLAGYLACLVPPEEFRAAVDKAVEVALGRAA